VSLAVPLVGAGQDSRAQPVVSIKEVMEKTIAPATNSLWNIAESPTDDEWAALEEAAVTLLVAVSAVGDGGTGPKDAEWVAAPAWQAFNEVLLSASKDALAAVRARDVTALRTAGDVLYPPCEGCHLQFNPGVAGVQ
jgi:cytochrome c556